MDGYELQAQSYEQYLEQHPEQSALVREDIERKIKTLRMFVGTSDADKDEMFNSGAFNDICKGYFRKSMENCKLPKETIDNIMDEFKWLLDTVSAGEVRNY